MMARLRKICATRGFAHLAGALMLLAGLAFGSSSAFAENGGCNGQSCSTYQQSAPMTYSNTQPSGHAVPCPECSQRVLVVPKPAEQCAKKVAQVEYHAPCRVCGNFRVSVREQNEYRSTPCNQQ
ncbi:hypothetical protein ACKC9G_08140 [Pokkaliibacter sp. CJK22405]|uniref:hypothetical protein n=1 Tax=Pokkaliibacter sp. CJK22405 TaxID=3384615 RepID=UPI003984C984